MVSCDSGAAAFAAAADFHPHLLLLDVMMPDMDGSDTLRALRRLENTADVPAIFMTAKAQTTQLAGLRNLGVLDVLIKPFDPRTLSDCLNEIWRRGRQSTPTQYRDGACISHPGPHALCSQFFGSRSTQRGIIVRRSKTLAKFRQNKSAAVVGMGHFLPAFVRHAAHSGYDCIWLDLEHRAMDPREIQSFLAFCHLADIDCMVRSPSREPTQLYRYLEDGAAGIMAQMVNTKEEAEAIVQAVKFPPVGQRGMDGAGLDCDFMLAADENYSNDANRETFVAIQIETIEAMENVEEIAAVDGFDILFVGPGDLGLRLSKSETPQPSLDECLERAAAAAAANGKIMAGIGHDKEMLQKRYDQGCRFMVNLGDYPALLRAADTAIKMFHDVCGE